MIKKGLIIYYILFIFLLWTDALNGQETTRKQQFNETEWKKINRTVNYDETFRERKPRKKKEKKPRKRRRNKLADNITLGQLKWFKNLMFVLIIGILATILFFILRYTVLKQSEKVKKVKKLNLENFEEDIENADLKQLLQDALSAGSFRLALRIQYLMVIATLSNMKWITWKKDKTNGTYLQEMYGREGYEDFKNITGFFERYWYGDKSINRNVYETLSDRFNTFNGYLQQHE